MMESVSYTHLTLPTIVYADLPYNKNFKEEQKDGSKQSGL